MGLLNLLTDHYLGSHEEKVEWENLKYKINTAGGLYYVEVELFNLPPTSSATVIMICTHCGETWCDRWPKIVKYGDLCPHCGRFDSYNEFKLILNNAKYPKSLDVDFPSGYYWRPKDRPMASNLITASYIRSKPEYIIWKQDVLRKYGIVCARCKTTSRAIEVHHRISMKSLMDGKVIGDDNYTDEKFRLFDVTNGIPLCLSCHRVYSKTFKTEDINFKTLMKFLNGEDEPNQGSNRVRKIKPSILGVSINERGEFVDELL